MNCYITTIIFWNMKIYNNVAIRILTAGCSPLFKIMKQALAKQIQFTNCILCQFQQFTHGIVQLATTMTKRFLVQVSWDHVREKEKWPVYVVDKHRILIIYVRYTRAFLATTTNRA
jgi:hypothetical protein